MSRWFRWYEGTCEDGKFRVVARNASVTVATVMGVWASLLEDASHDDHRGVAIRGEDFYAAVLDLDLTVLASILAEMQDINLIACCTDNTIEITSWKERQYETDKTDSTNAQRQKNWREKHKGNGKSKDRNGTVTAAKLPDTDTDTDTDTDKNIRLKPSRVRYDDKFEEAWQAYPRRDGGNPKPPSAKLFLAAVKAGADPQAIIDGAKRFAAAEARNVGTPFIPQMVKWLRDKRWLDYTGDGDVIKFDIRRHLV